MAITPPAGPSLSAAVNQFGTEESDLSRLLADTVDEIFANADELTKKRNATFNEHRFRERLERYDYRSRRLGWLREILNVVVIAGGLITSGTIALGDVNSHRVQGFLIFVGLLVGVLTAINQIFRPGARSVTYGRAASDLRREGWDFLYHRGKYSRAENDTERYNLLVGEISEIHSRAEVIPGTEDGPDGEHPIDSRTIGPRT